jgi:hypothetical protein
MKIKKFRYESEFIIFLAAVDVSQFDVSIFFTIVHLFPPSPQEVENFTENQPIQTQTRVIFIIFIYI